MTILIFKAHSEFPDGSDEDPYVVAFRNAGMEAEILDVIDFEYINLDSLKFKVQHPQQFGGIIFTSPRSVLAVKQCTDEDFCKSEWSKLPCYVVGETTSNVLKQHLGIIGTGEASGSAEMLASFICEGEAGTQMKPLLYPGSEQRRSSLFNTLATNNIPVDVVTCYRTVPHSHLSEKLRKKLNSCESVVEMLVFFSPSGVEAVSSTFCNLGICLSKYKVVAIGPSTEKALKQQGQTTFATAVKPSPSSLIEAVQLASRDVDT